MRDTAIIRRGMDAIRRISRFFSSAEPAVRHNIVLAKWEQHYDAYPDSFSRRQQHSILNYLTPAD